MFLKYHFPPPYFLRKWKLVNGYWCYSFSFFSDRFCQVRNCLFVHFRREIVACPLRFLTLKRNISECIAWSVANFSEAVRQRCHWPCPKIFDDRKIFAEKLLAKINKKRRKFQKQINELDYHRLYHAHRKCVYVDGIDAKSTLFDAFLFWRNLGTFSVWLKQKIERTKIEKAFPTLSSLTKRAITLVDSILALINFQWSSRIYVASGNS